MHACRLMPFCLLCVEVHDVTFHACSIFIVVIHRYREKAANCSTKVASSSSLLSHQSGSHHRPQCACLTHVCDIQGLGVCACTYVPLWLCAKHHTYALHSEPKLGGLSQHSYTSCGIPGHDSIPPQPYKTKNHSVDAMTLQQASNNK